MGLKLLVKTNISNQSNHILPLNIICIGLKENRMNQCTNGVKRHIDKLLVDKSSLSLSDPASLIPTNDENLSSENTQIIPK